VAAPRQQLGSERSTLGNACHALPPFGRASPCLTRHRAFHRPLPRSQDDLIERLGGPNQVAEMTGRKKRMLLQKNGKYAYVSRADDSCLDEVRGCQAQAPGSRVCRRHLPHLHVHVHGSMPVPASALRLHGGLTHGTMVCLRQVNILERGAFQDGRKQVAIISDAASAGISLQVGLHPIPGREGL